MINRLAAKIRNLSVVWKVIVAYFIILIVPLSLTSYYVFAISVRQVIDQTKTMINQSLLQARENILDNVRMAENVSQTIGFNKKLCNFLDTEYEATGQQVVEYITEILPYMETVWGLNPSIYSIWIFTTNSSIPPSWQTSYGIENISEYFLYENGLNEREELAWWEKAHLSPLPVPAGMSTKGLHMFSYNLKMYSQHKHKLLGVLHLQIPVKNMFSTLETIDREKLGKFFVVDDKGNIVSDAYPDLYKRNIRDVLDIGNFLEKPDSSMDIRVDGADYIISKVSIREIECNIVSILPMSGIESEIKKTKSILFIVISLSFLLLFFIEYATGKKLMKRLMILLNAMDEVKKENFEVRIAPGPLDEFGSLIDNFNTMIQMIKELITNIYKSKIKEKEAEFKALEAQINPHFLFNTLTSISYVAKNNNDFEVSMMANVLAKFYRTTLNNDVILISVRQEIDHLQSYITLQKIRFKHLFDAIYNIDENVYECKIIKIILQPIVENALSHGIEPKMSHGTLIINAWKDETTLFFEIIDDGVGISPDKVSAIMNNRLERGNKGGYGLKNVNERLKIYYGDQYGINIFSRVGIGTCVSVRIPVNSL
jgi:two-component system sensor histidine kinase YesM